MATFAVTLDNGSVITFEGNLTGDIAGGFNGWTQDGSSEAVTVTLTDPASIPLAFKPPSGATAAATDQVEVYDDVSVLVFFVDAAGNMDARLSPTGGGGSFNFSGLDGNPILKVGDDGVNKIVRMPSLPTADPHIAGQLYTTAGAVMVSAG